MMTPWQLHSALWTITLLRREELVAEGVIDARDDEAWAKFSADRFGWIMMRPDKSEQVWRAIWRHVPRTIARRSRLLSTTLSTSPGGARLAHERHSRQRLHRHRL